MRTRVQQHNFSNMHDGHEPLNCKTSKDHKDAINVSDPNTFENIITLQICHLWLQLCQNPNTLRI